MNLDLPGIGFIYGLLIYSGPSLIYFYGQYRELRNRPLSKISSLSIGQVEVSGLAKFNNRGCLYSPYSKTECCYYRAFVEYNAHSSSPSYSQIQVSSNPFILCDDGNECVVYPHKVVLEGKHFKVQRFKQGCNIYTETLILPGMPLLITGVCSFDESVDKRKRFEKLFQDSIDASNELTGYMDEKLIIRAPEKCKDGINFDFVISSISREDIIKKYFAYSILLLCVVLGCIAIILYCLSL